MVAKAKANKSNDGDFFLPDLRGEIEIERVFQHNGDKGVSVILTATILTCAAKKEGATKHLPGAKVKKVYAISKFPTVAPGQLKGDLLAIDGLNEDDVSAKDIEGFLAGIFVGSEKDKNGEVIPGSGPMFELRGYRTAFDTRLIDRSAKGKENLTGVIFKHIENKPEEVAERAKAIAARLK